MTGLRLQVGTIAGTRWRQGLYGAAAIAVLGGVFALYLQPDWVMQLSQILWTCL